MDKCMSSIKRQRSANGTQLSKLVETATHDTIHVILHRQLRVKVTPRQLQYNCKRCMGKLFAMSVPVDTEVLDNLGVRSF